jgi:hypothetical protein
MTSPHVRGSYSDMAHRNPSPPTLGAFPPLYRPERVHPSGVHRSGDIECTPATRIPSADDAHDFRVLAVATARMAMLEGSTCGAAATPSP